MPSAVTILGRMPVGGLDSGRGRSPALKRPEAASRQMSQSHPASALSLKVQRPASRLQAGGRRETRPWQAPERMPEEPGARDLGRLLEHTDESAGEFGGLAANCSIQRPRGGAGRVGRDRRIESRSCERFGRVAAARRRSAQTASLFEVKWKSRARIAGTIIDEESLAGRDRDARRLEVLQEVDRAVVEPEVVDRVDDLPLLDQPDAVAGQAGDRGVLGVDGAGCTRTG